MSRLRCYGMLLAVPLGSMFFACGTSETRSDERDASAEGSSGMDSSSGTDSGSSTDSGSDGGGKGIRSIDRGVFNWCEVHENGSLECRRPSAQLDGGGYPSPFLTQVKSLGLGFYTHVALHEDGTVSRWSDTAGGFSPASTLANVTGAIAVSSRCYLTAGKSVKCFDPADDPMGGLSGIEAIAAGETMVFSCAITAARTVKCWGDNSEGQLGNGDTAESKAPVDVVGLSGVDAISAWHSFACALLADHTVKCWGDNLHHALGAGSNDAFSSVPVVVGGLQNVRAISTGYHHACALLMDGHVKCWGQNDSGQLGNGGTTESSTPVDVNGVADAVLLAAGLSSSCVVTSQGVTKCWP